MEFKNLERLIKENDQIWAFLVRSKAGFICQICKKPSSLLKTYYIIDKSNWNTRWDTTNGIAVCSNCYNKLQKLKNKEKLLKNIIGEPLYELLINESKYPYQKDFNTAEAWNKILRAEFVRNIHISWDNFKEESKYLLKEE